MPCKGCGQKKRRLTAKEKEDQAKTQAAVQAEAERQQRENSLSRPSA